MESTIINLNSVEESTSRALNYVKEQEDALEGINRIVNTMEDAWDSDAQKAYADSFRRSRERIQRFNESVTQSVNNMRNFVSDCVSADELTAREILNVSW